MPRKLASQGKRNVLLEMAGNLGWPLFWGLAACVGFYALIHQGILRGEFVQRYFANHEVEYTETAMFFVGLAALVVKSLDIAGQYAGLKRVQLPDAPAAGQNVEDCPTLLAHLAKLPANLKNCYLARRLREALELVHLNGSADEMSEDLRYLADVDANRQQESYAQVRLVIWAIPILGFLGTVIGITMALSSLSPEALASGSKETMGGLTSGLSVAFDTTSLALSLSIVLMFALFFVERAETQLLEVVDGRVNEELVGRFGVSGAGSDPQLAAVRRMSEALMATCDKLVRQQAEIWQGTIQAAHEQWSRLVASAGGQVQSSLSTALETSLKAHAKQLVVQNQEAVEQGRQQIELLHAAVAESAKLMRAQQAEMVKQGQVMLKAIEATGQVASLEKALNDNLHSLAGAKNFEDTVMSLAAAIHLLNARIGGTGAGGGPVALGSAAATEPRGRAA